MNECVFNHSDQPAVALVRTHQVTMHSSSHREDEVSEGARGNVRPDYEL